MNRTARICDFVSWQNRSREFLSHEVAPEAINWQDEGERVFALPLEVSSLQPVNTGKAPGVFTIPRELLRLLETCACHRGPRKWALMYRIVWRVHRGERHVLQLAADPEVSELIAMAHAVDHDCHKMKAFVRFREVEDDAAGKRFVAWFEPQHLILRKVAPLFVDRFASMHWTIVTPDGAAHWDGHNLQFLAQSGAFELPSSDDKEALWRAYYASIFNPSRVNQRLMMQHMPKRYWQNLPEAHDIAQLSNEAQQRTHAMLQTAPRDFDRWQAAAELAREATLAVEPDTLRASISACRRCPLFENATQAVAGSGPTPAALMIVGEQPGDEEDLRGQPFVGPAGRLLDRALQAARIDRSLVYVTNAVKHFKWEPRGKRRMHKTPAQMEIAACVDWLEREIATVQPQAIVALGATALNALLKRRESVSRARVTHLVHGGGARIIATYHPAAILRAQPGTEDELYETLCEDLRLARRVSGENQ